MTEICDSVSEAEIRTFSLIFGYPGTEGGKPDYDSPPIAFRYIYSKISTKETPDL
jgi:hypothetical protein